jgi:hypothetical protein
MQVWRVLTLAFTYIGILTTLAFIKVGIMTYIERRNEEVLRMVEYDIDNQLLLYYYKRRQPHGKRKTEGS